MYVYVAGKTQDLVTVRAVQKKVRDANHEISHDWTAIVEENGGDANEVEIPEEQLQQYAVWDMTGVMKCNLLIAVGHPNLCGTLWETGAAAILGKAVWLVYWERCSRSSVFENLPNVAFVDYHTLGERLERARSIELQAKLIQGVNGQDISKLARHKPEASS